jgi:hypothetical protein
MFLLKMLDRSSILTGMFHQVARDVPVVYLYAFHLTEWNWSDEDIGTFPPKVGPVPFFENRE